MIYLRHVHVACIGQALWRVINIVHTPDFDLLEQIYNSAAILLAPN
jgi:hypothetical protein